MLEGPARAKAARAWLRLNFELGLLSFAPASRAVLYRERVVVRHGWLSDDEFSEALTISQLLPGPNLVNLSVYLGLRLCGGWAAVGGLLLLALPGALLAVALASLLPLHNPDIDRLLAGLALGGIGLMVVFLRQLAACLKPPPVAARPPRTAARWLLIAAITTALTASLPLGPVVALAVPAALCIEFV